jgi:hypothetical protein
MTTIVALTVAWNQFAEKNFQNCHHVLSPFPTINIITAQAGRQELGLDTIGQQAQNVSLKKQ